MGGFREPARLPAAAAQAGVQVSNTKELGILLYTEYLFPLEIAAVILLVAIVAAIALTLRERKDSKFVDPSDQIKVRARDRLTVLKVESSRVGAPPAPPPPPEPQAPPTAPAVEKKP